MMGRIGVSGKKGVRVKRLAQKVFERLYNDALARMERTAETQIRKHSEQRSHWEAILGQRDLYGEHLMPVNRLPASGHLAQAWDAIPDASIVTSAPHAPADMRYFFTETVHQQAYQMQLSPRDDKEANIRLSQRDASHFNALPTKAKRYELFRAARRPLPLGRGSD